MKVQSKKSNAQNSKSNSKPVYKKKAKVIITNTDALASSKKKGLNNSEFAPTYVLPSEKYTATIQCLMKKGFFIVAKNGEKINFTDIIEYHVATKNDVPVVVTQVKKANKYGGGISTIKRVFNLIRFNDEEIVGLQSRNTNPWMMKTIDVSKIKKV